MEYKKTLPAAFVKRVNRFVARVEIDGVEHTVHVKNTGRLRELLVPGATVLLAPADNPNRKTAFDLVAAERDGMLFNIDSLAPNKVAAEYLPGLFQNMTLLKGEALRGNSRLDFYVEAEGWKGKKERGDPLRGFIEVKGITLFRDGGAFFPDAPTERGIKHLLELADCAKQGLFAAVLFVVQFTGAHFVAPNDATGTAFGEALRQAEAAGVRMLAVECAVTETGLFATSPLPVHTKN